MKLKTGTAERAAFPGEMLADRLRGSRARELKVTKLYGIFPPHMKTTFRREN